MKKYIIPSIVFLIGLSLITWGISHIKKQPEIIKQTTDQRGLISVIFKEGKDTLAFDYLTLNEYDSIFLNR